MLKILVAEDDVSTNKLLCAILKINGYEAIPAFNGEAALDIIDHQHIDLLLCDVMMPKMDGFALTQAIRDGGSMMPILMLTAKALPEDKHTGFLVGTDDYMTKPFSMRELIARCKALLRRVERAKVIAKNSENEKLLDFGSMVIDPAQRIVTVNGEQVHLTPTEFDLLATLARRPKSVLTREKLLEEVWDWVDASGTRTVDSHVKALRHKLGADTIRTVHGVGYAFEPPTA